MHIYIYIHPITINEVKSCYGTLHDGAPGIDGIKKCDLTKIGLNNITARFKFISYHRLHLPHLN